MKAISNGKREVIYVLFGFAYLIVGLLQQFLVNHLPLTATIAIVVSLVGMFTILLTKEEKLKLRFPKEDKKQFTLFIIFACIAFLNFIGYFINRFIMLSVLGIIAFIAGIGITVMGIIGYFIKGKKIFVKIVCPILGCILFLISGFFSLTTIAPATTMSLFGSAIMGSESSNVVTAEQKESVLDDGTKLLSDVQYDAEIPNGFLDIYYTTKTSSGNVPTFIFIHGGGYVWGDKVIGDPNMIKEGPTDLITTNFLKQGYNVVQMNYALAPKYQFPLAIKQLNRGLRFLVQKGNEYGLDMNNIIISGGSAGGNLAGLLVNIQTNPDYAKIIDETAVINPECIKGVYFLAALYDNSRFGSTGSVTVDWMFTQLGRLYLGTNELKNNKNVVTPSNVTEYMTAAFPPTFISDGNTGTFCDQAFDAYLKLKELGVDTEINYYPKNVAELTHGYEGNDNRYSEIMYDRLFDFLSKYIGA